MYSYIHPELFPTDNDNIRNSLALAPFWSDNDIRKEGAVRYATYNSVIDNHPNGSVLLNLMNVNIQALQDEESVKKFVGSWMLIAHWDGVHPSPHGGDVHGGISEKELDRVSHIHLKLLK